MEASLKARGIKKYNLLPWFLEDHGQLPASYLKSCKKFFKKLASERARGEGGPEGHELTKKNT